MPQPRDHGGSVDAARAEYGGAREDWLDLSTGINPEPYSAGIVASAGWQQLPDKAALDALLTAARNFWDVPESAAILAAPGASALIAQIPYLHPPARVRIAARTYNEHAASFAQAGWTVMRGGPCEAAAVVHPNNPDGALASPPDAPFSIIDESFCDTNPTASLISEAAKPGRLILKSFGKFWGLAGLRLGFAIGDPDLISSLSARLGPWAVSGPALEIGARALSDFDWAAATSTRLAEDAERLDSLMVPHGKLIGGTTLFRLYDVGDAAAFQAQLCHARILTRIFPYSRRWVRLGLPPRGAFPRLEAALGTVGGAIRASGSAVPPRP